MSAIDRHDFFGLKQHLDYSVQLGWVSEAPLSRDSEGDLVPNPDLDAPKPDLAVAFRLDSIVQSHDYDTTLNALPATMRHHAMPENITTPQDSTRAFPFLMINALGNDAPYDDGAATERSCSDAAHALFNIWMFVKDHEDLRCLFFERVRVFTAGGNGEKFWVRVHRAERLPEKQGRLHEEYPLTFQYEEVLRKISGEEYTKANVRGLMGGCDEVGG